MEPIVLTPWLEHLSAHLPVALEGRDPEGVHQVRVAAGRLVVWLQLAGLRVLRDDLRWLRGGAGRLRELDVLLGSDPPAELCEWLEARRGARRRELEETLADRRLEGLLSALPLLPPLSPARAADGVAELARAARKRGARIEAEPTDLDGFHELRKALRRLRFAKEWLGEETRPLRGLQSTLGDLNDHAVALELLNEYPGRDALEGYRRELLEKLDKKRRKALERWSAYAPALEGEL